MANMKNRGKLNNKPVLSPIKENSINKDNFNKYNLDKSLTASVSAVGDVLDSSDHSIGSTITGSSDPMEISKVGRDITSPTIRGNLLRYHSFMAVIQHVVCFFYTILGPWVVTIGKFWLRWGYGNEALTLPYWGMSMSYYFAVMKIGICMSACLHRYFSHNAFQTSRPISVVMGWIACHGGQRGPLWWASKHVRHHKHCDNELDPHSPQRVHKAYAFLFWTVSPTEMFCDYDFLPLKFHTPELVFIDSIAYFIPLLEHFLIYQYFGKNFALISYWSTIGCLYGTLAFNVIFHWVHHDEEVEQFQDGTYKCAANDRVPGFFRNVLGISGEYAHEDHHVHPNRAKRPTHLIDLPYWLFIKPGHKLGIFRKINMGEGIKIE